MKKTAPSTPNSSAVAFGYGARRNPGHVGPALAAGPLHFLVSSLVPLPTRKTANLRRGRISIPGARYFVTACTAARAPVLTHPSTAELLHEVLGDLHASGDATFAAATVMPDHVHLLFTLGSNLQLGQVVAKLKTLARNRGRSTWRWQENAFEHRLRAHESIEDYGFYVFMNPYRAGLCTMNMRWPWWFCPEPAQTMRLPASGSPTFSCRAGARLPAIALGDGWAAEPHPIMRLPASGSPTIFHPQSLIFPS